ncbi:MAG TPA: PilZ domain-containing protein [Verrucomicrobiae bacterium]|nr:PilZ domain-containing protein [Verrucomicrobiae bacterium]
MENSSDAPSSSRASFPEKREVPRFSFIATVTIVEHSSDMRIDGRISEISRKGCYVDVLNTLPVGTPIELKVARDQGDFSTPARIIYVQEGIGMGVAFVETPPDQMTILDAWLTELRS